MCADAPTPALRCGTFLQVRDHDVAGSGRFSQRYLRDESNLQGDSTQPVLLLLGGETGVTYGDLPGLQDFAKAQGATLLELENRFYGQSYPVADLNIDSMATNTSAQALADIVAFITEMKTEPVLSGPWIVIGGSYGGFQAAIIRALHPDLVQGAVASSAPVYLKQSFPEYGQMASADLPAACATAFRAATALIDHTAAADWPALMTALQRSPQSAVLDLDFELASYVGGMAQYGWTDSQAQACQALQGATSVAQVSQLFAAMNQEEIRQWGASQQVAPCPQCMSLAPDPTGPPAPPPIPALTDPAAANWVWSYQQCHEFGLFLTAGSDQTKTVFSPNLTLAAAQNETCSAIPGAETALTATIPRIVAVDVTPLLGPNTSHILFTHGSLDPWSPSMIQTLPADAATRDLATLEIDGGTHAQDLYPQEGAPQAVTAARQQIQSAISRWAHRSP